MFITWFLSSALGGGRHEQARKHGANRRWRIGALTITAMLIIAGATGQTTKKTDVPDLVRARKFQLVDETGKVRATLAYRKGESMLTLWALDQKPRVRLTTWEAGPGVYLHDASGGKSAAFIASKDGPRLDFYGLKDTHRGGLMAFKDGTSLTLRDRDGKLRVKLLAYHMGPSLALLDEEDKPRATLGVFDDAPTLQFNDKVGTARAVLNVPGSRGPGLQLFDSAGTLREEVTVLDRRPGLYLYDKRGKRSVGLVAQPTGPAMAFFDKRGRPRAELTVSGGEPKLELTDSHNRKTVIPSPEP